MTALTTVVETYLAAIAAQDWDAAADCLAEDVRRAGPFGDRDVYQGRDAYLDYLKGVMPGLARYRMEIHRIVTADAARTVVAELSETVHIEGEPVSTPEALIFDLDPSDRISQVRIYIQRSD